MKVAEKVIVVTGAGNGIGREIALLLLEKGARVAAVDVNADFLEETKVLAGSRADKLSLHAIDISDLTSVEQLPGKVISLHGQVDGLMNVAGIIQPFIKTTNLGYEQVDRVMNINFYGTLYMTKSFLPDLLKRPEAHILNVSSMGGFLPVPGQGIYGASKAAVKLFTEALSAELTGTNVGVTIAFPGAVQTNITGNSGVAIPKSVGSDATMKALPARKAAEMIVQAFETGKFRVLVGSDARFMDFIYRLAPEFAKNFIRKKMSNLLG
jgi:short-subunit dehydrogenase